jgi:hypothetical protein
LGNGDSFATPALAGSTTYIVKMEGLPCPAGPATVTVTVNVNLTPGITISSVANDICSGTAVVFSSAITNGGALPVYEWRRNGQPAGVGATCTLTPDNGDAVTCVLTSDLACATTNPVTSNVVTMMVTPTVAPKIKISAVPD